MLDAIKKISLNLDLKTISKMIKVLEFILKYYSIFFLPINKIERV